MSDKSRHNWRMQFGHAAPWPRMLPLNHAKLQKFRNAILNMLRPMLQFETISTSPSTNTCSPDLSLMVFQSNFSKKSLARSLQLQLFSDEPNCGMWEVPIERNLYRKGSFFLKSESLQISLIFEGKQPYIKSWISIASDELSLHLTWGYLISQWKSQNCCSVLVPSLLSFLWR